MSSKGLVASQICCMFLLLIGTLFCGVIPIYVQKTLFRCDCTGGVCKSNCRARKGKLITSFLIYLGGGVLLGTTFIHLLPEAREGFEDHDDHDDHQNDAIIAADNATEEEHGGHDHESFPLPEFIILCGFFAVYLFEEIVHYFLGGHTHVPSETKTVRKFTRSASCAPPAIECGKLDSENLTGDVRKFSTSGNETTNSTDQIACKDDSGPERFSLTALLTVAALSFHSLFEGFAVGLRKTAVSTWIVFAAISVHKFVLAFVLGLEILATGGRRIQVFSYMGVFSLMSPIGMAIAMITENSVEETNPMTVSVLNAIATGTLLYVTFFEILHNEEHNDLPKWIQLIATFLGFGVMCLMQFASTFA